ncbi:CGNR zinc finger domain-containing protein [Chitinophaga sp. Hz27]|uniref:CGNR zinc finger domain-containing protein n=1 Tax=Chitinophaga sp. Hz27 TaxID=3347169 RepID=UPI0035E038D3
MSTPVTISTIRLDGGICCLDFVNTISERFRADQQDYLQHYKDICIWSLHTGIISPKTIQTLERLAKDFPVKAVQAFDKSIRLRELLYVIFRQLTLGKPLADNDLLSFNTYISEAYTNMEFSWDKQLGYGQLSLNAPGLELPIWKIVQSAAGLLASSQVNQVKQCPRCGKLFLDKSKNSSRRWCSMATCGDLNKVTRFQQKQKKGK